MENDVNETRKRLIEELTSLGEKVIRGAVAYSKRKRKDGVVVNTCRLMIPAGPSQSRGVHIVKSIEPEAVEGVAAYKRAREIICELGMINIKILRQKARREKAEARELKRAAKAELKERIKREKAEARELRRAKREELKEQARREREAFRARPTRPADQDHPDPKRPVIKSVPPPTPKKPRPLTAKDLMQPAKPDDAVPLLASSTIPLSVNLPL